MKVKVKEVKEVKLDTDEIKALKTLAEVDCTGISCFDCPLDSIREYCLKIDAIGLLNRLGGDNNE